MKEFSDTDCIENIVEKGEITHREQLEKGEIAQDV